MAGFETGDDEQAGDSRESSGYVVPIGPTAEGTAAQKEQNQIEQKQKQHDAARRFDKQFRKQIAVDRRYAAGKPGQDWTVSANIVGYVLDILVSILYARDPDINVRKAPQVDDDDPVNIDIEAWAKTLEIVISLLWKKAPLRVPLKRQVRGSLTVSAGWLKANMLTTEVPQPEVEKRLTDAMERKDQIKAQRELVDGDYDGSPEEQDDEELELDSLIATSRSKLDASTRQDFVIEYVAAQNIQLSLDVECEEDYLNCSWIDFDLYVTKEDVLADFDRLKEEDLKQATCYYQKRNTAQGSSAGDTNIPEGSDQLGSDAADMYTTNQGADDQDVAMYKVIERWSKRDGRIYTWIEGVKRWAKEPFEPNFATSRFYPCFRLAFFDVDGERHGQSIPFRIASLQDEFSCARSNFRLARERNIPSTLFDATNIPDEEAKKLSDSKIQEYIALRPTDPSKPIGNNFAPKPTGQMDPRVYDTTPILMDINRITGVQEALQGAAQGPKTATEAQLEQMGMNARTTSDRDTLEWMLADLAIFTGETAIQALKLKEVQQMVGPSAFWPEGRGADTLRRLVNITIEAGSTGKPRKNSDQQAWGVILPLIEKTIGQIMVARQAGNNALAKALEELVKETMRRMGDESDVERFIPQVQNTPPPNTGPPPPSVSISLKGVVPQEDANAIAAKAAGLPVPAGPGAALSVPPPAGGGAAPPGQPPMPGVAAPPTPGQEPGPQGPPPGAVPPVH